MRLISFFVLSLVSFSLAAKDLGFRYQGGRCVDPAGKVGLNPDFVGVCGNLPRAILEQFTFDDTDLSGSQFEAADLQLSTFARANLTGVNFTGANLSGVDLGAAILHSTNFSGADLRNVNMADADIVAANFTGADLTAALLSFVAFKSSILDRAKLSGAQLDHAGLSGSHLAGAELARADLSKADLSNVEAAGVDLQGSLLRGANLSGGHFSGGNFRHAQGERADFSRAVVTKADFRSALLKGVRADGVDWTAALYNKRTILPFAVVDAGARGLILKNGGLVYVLWDVQDDNFNTLVAALRAADMELTLSPTRELDFDGLANLSEYSAVLHLEGAIGGCDNGDIPTAGQKALVEYVHQGGLYIETEWAACRYCFKEVQGMRELILLDRQSESSGAIQVKVNPAMASDPLLAGIIDFALPMALYNIGKVHEFSNNPARVLLTSDQSGDFLVARDFGSGHVVDFAMACAMGFPCFGSEQVQRIVVNALGGF